MKIIKYTDPDFEQTLGALLNRSAFSPAIDEAVAEILRDIRSQGDSAVAKYAGKFDRVELTPDQFRIDTAVIGASSTMLTTPQKDAIQLAHRQVAEFAEQRVPRAWSFSPRNGVVLGERFAPLSRVAAYIPGGTAPLISTVLHTITMAQVAGVEEIVVTTPPRADGTVNPAILYAAGLAGATEIYRLGGVYAVAALGYGTETIRKVEKIVGPGNAYVTAAKRQIYGEAALDLVAGPSEVLILADETATPAFAAADMLAQAEHGSGFEQAVIVSTSNRILEEVQQQITKQAATIKRSECVEKVINNGMFFILAADLDAAIAIANRYAPEHLEIVTADPDAVALRITAAGAMFLGEWTPEPVGDFVAGPSHVLPTGGAARFFSGLTVEDFFRRMSTVKYTKEALVREADAIAQLAAMEQLDAHGRSAAIRLE